MRRIALGLAAAAAFIAAAPAQATTTIFSVDFESGFGVFTPTGQVGVNSGQDYADCCGATGSSGSLTNHFASFGSGDQASGTIESPSFLIVPSETYLLTFDYGALGRGAESIVIEIGAFTFTLPVTGGLDLDAALTPGQVSFSTITGGPATVSISGLGTASVDAIIDNLVFTTTADLPPPGVPEPATWAMMLLGFAAVGAAMRRRKAPGGLRHA